MSLIRICILSLLSVLLLGAAGCDNRNSGKDSSAQPGSKAIAPKEFPTIRMLAWVGYNEPDFVSEIEQRAGVKLQVKTYVSGLTLRYEFQVNHGFLLSVDQLLERVCRPAQTAIRQFDWT